MKADVLALSVNLVVCAAIAVQCLCRAVKFLDKSHPWFYRHAYTLLGTSAISAALFWHWLHPWGHLVLLGSVAFVLWLNSSHWPLSRKGK